MVVWITVNTTETSMGVLQTSDAGDIILKSTLLTFSNEV